VLQAYTSSQVNKFIQNIFVQYVHTHTQLQTINKHTYQDQYIVTYVHMYRYKLHHFTS